MSWETRGWECKPLLWKALLLTWVQKESTKNPSMAVTARGKLLERSSRKAVPVQSKRKSFCNCTNGKRKAEKTLLH